MIPSSLPPRSYGKTLQGGTDSGRRTIKHRAQTSEKSLKNEEGESKGLSMGRGDRCKGIR